jgi:hypothetical protein
MATASPTTTSLSVPIFSLSSGPSGSSLSSPSAIPTEIEPASSSPASSPIGAIVGGVVGSVIGLSLIAVLLLFLFRRRTRDQDVVARQYNEADTPGSTPEKQDFDTSHGQRSPPQTTSETNTWYSDAHTTHTVPPAIQGNERQRAETLAKHSIKYDQRPNQRPSDNNNTQDVLHITNDTENDPERLGQRFLSSVNARQVELVPIASAQEIAREVAALIHGTTPVPNNGSGLDHHGKDKGLYGTGARGVRQLPDPKSYNASSAPGMGLGLESPGLPRYEV